MFDNMERWYGGAPRMCLAPGSKDRPENEPEALRIGREVLDEEGIGMFRLPRSGDHRELKTNF